MQPALKACPTCGQDTVAELGLRDYSRWLSPVLPGRIGGTDLDCVLDQSSTGRMLVQEYKQGNQRLPMGQRLLFKGLVEKGFDVWVVWEYSNHVKVGAVDLTGEVRFMEQMSTTQLAAKTRAWWYDGLTQAP